ncbi:MAG: flippase-like domain-containing protein [Polyangiaceae bacterium]|nr:flippase-like domain-containing protein [Polyangiaceae bacterium]
MSIVDDDETVAPSRGRRVASTLAKLALSVALLAWVLSRVDLASALARLAHPHILPLLVAVALTFVQWPITAVRWYLLLRSLDAPLSFRRCLSAQLVSLLMSQALPTVGGDAWRVVAVRRSGGSFRVGLLSVLLDRLIALLALAVVVAATQPWFYAHVAPGPLRTLTSVGLALTSAGLGVALLADRVLVPLTRVRFIGRAVELVTSTAAAARTVLSSRRSPPILALSLTAHVLTGVAVYFLALSFDVRVSLTECVVLMPPVVLLAVLPISLAGWGVREGSMVAFFALVGVPSESALTLSIALGIALLISSIPGAIAFATGRG